MLFKSKKFLVIFLLLVSGCGFSSLNKLTTNDNIHIETPSDKYNILFKKNLNKAFNINNSSQSEYVLKSSISFSSSETLSVNGSDTLNSTFANANFSLIEIKSNKVIKSGSIKTFPALSSSSSSIYSNEMSIQHIKERLSFSAANKIHMRLNLILQKLN
tara:strand:- start:90 stop:566 length:477 start_codon:yes stop_codon:yes gene_type:complete